METFDTIEKAERAKRRIRWLIASRLVLALMSIGLVLILTSGSPTQEVNLYFSFLLLAFTLLLNAAYFVLSLFIKAGYERFIIIQVVMDGLLETMLIYLTGGASSIFLVLYFASVLGATILISPRGGMFLASLTTILLACVTVIFYFGSRFAWPLPFITPGILSTYHLNLSYVLAFLVAEAAGLHMVALLAGVLAKSMSEFKKIYEEILRQMGDGILAIDRQGRILFINDETRKLLLYNKDDFLIGRKFSEIFRRREERDIFAILDRREEVDMELDVPLRSGATKTINIKVTILYDRRGRMQGIIGIFTDLTARRRIEMLEGKAAKYDEMSEIAAGIAHEIRNPIASIRGAIQELGHLDIRGGDNRRLADIVMREGDRLDGIINDFLKFASMKEPFMEDVALVPLIEEVALLLRSRPDAAGIEIDVGVDGTYTVRGEANQIKQVFLNLGINALEAMGGEGKLLISVSPWEIASRITSDTGGSLPHITEAVAVSFADTGHGINPEDIKKIFVPFFTTRTKGTGMGLAIVEKIVSAHRGLVDVSCVRDGGCTFRVVMPLVRTEEEKE